MRLNNKEIASQCIILMGVSGCGKTTIGKALAKRLGWDFIESDDYHSAEDVRKMANGIPLTDADRQPWLRRLHATMVEKLNSGRSCVVACSALKETYREVLREGLGACQFIYLQGDFELIKARMQQRTHFMKAGMLRSQFDALEEPKNALVVDIRKTPEVIVGDIIDYESQEKPPAFG